MMTSEGARENRVSPEALKDAKGQSRANSDLILRRQFALVLAGGAGTLAISFLALLFDAAHGLTDSGPASYIFPILAVFGLLLLFWLAVDGLRRRKRVRQKLHELDELRVAVGKGLAANSALIDSIRVKDLQAKHSLSP